MKKCRHPLGALVINTKDGKIYCRVCGRSVSRVRGGPRPHGVR